jgi:hypothetical protein
VESRAKLVVVDIELTKRIGALRDKIGAAVPTGSDLETPGNGGPSPCELLATLLESHRQLTVVRRRDRAPDSHHSGPDHRLLETSSRKRSAAVSFPIGPNVAIGPQCRAWLPRPPVPAPGNSPTRSSSDRS